MVLWPQGRIWWCKWGDWAIHLNEAWNSSHTPRQFFDPYTFTHVLHGVAFFWIAGPLPGKLSVEWKFLMAIVAESAWEVFENSSNVIDKYRQNTASLDYFGDSIANCSIGDLGACALALGVPR